MVRDAVLTRVRARHRDGERFAIGARQRRGLKHGRFIELEVCREDVRVEGLRHVDLGVATPSPPIRSYSSFNWPLASPGGMLLIHISVSLDITG